MSILTLGMVGVGNFGKYRRERLRETGLFRLAAAYDFSREALAQAEAEDGARPCASFDELLRTPGLDGLVVSTGAKFHAEQVIAGLERGLHVFCEKPLCATWDELRALLAARRRHPRLVISMGHNHHGALAGTRTLRRLIDEGTLGSLVAVEKTTGHSGGFHIKPGDWRGDPDKNPGGMLFQCGVHSFHELMYLFGPIAAVQAQMRSDVNPDTRTADAAQCLVRFASGMIGTLCAYHVIPYRHTLALFGTRSNVYYDDRYGDIGLVMARQERVDNQFEPHIPLKPEGGDDRCANLRAWHAACLAGSDQGLYPSLLDGARAVAAVFAAEESARDGGRQVAIPDLASL